MTSHTLRRTLLATVLALALTACGDSPASLLGKAREAISTNETKTAEIHLKNLLQKEENAEARYLLGTVYLKAGDLRGAEKELRRALEAGYDKGKVAPELAYVLLQLGSYRKLLDELADTKTEDPEAQANLLTSIGRAQLALGRHDEAKASFDGALAAKASYAPAQVSLISIRAVKGDVAGASAQVDQLLAQQPNSHDALALKGALEISQGRFKEAREHFRKAAAVDPLDRYSRANIAVIDITLKEYDAAQKALNELKQITGEAPGTMELQAQIHLRQGRLEQARDSVLAALKAAPDFLPALTLSAQVHLLLKDYEMAEQHAKRVIEATPSSPIGYRLLGRIYLGMSAPEKALQALQPMLDKGTKDGNLYAIAGEAALRANEPQRAAEYYEQAAKFEPKDARMVAGLAFASLARGDRERAIAELEQASDMESGSAQADFALVATHLRAREFDKALAAVDRLEKKQPDSALAANLRGTVLAAKGDLPNARKAFELAIKRDPKFLPATANLANLDLRDKKVEAARKRYTAFLEKDPKNVHAMLALAQIAEGSAKLARDQKLQEDSRAGKPLAPNAGDGSRGSPEALEWLKKAREADRTSIPAALAQAGWYIGDGQPKEAVTLLQEMLASNPGNIRLLDALGTAYLRSDQPAQAMEAFERIVRIKPDSAALQLRLGQLKLSRGDTAGAMQNLRKAADLDPKAIEPRATIAAVEIRAGRTDEARKIATALQKEQPKSPAGLLLEGDIAMHERKYGEAAGAYRKALAVQKALPISLRLHRALSAAGMDKEADSLLQGLVKERPDDLQLRMYAGDVDVTRGQWRNAIAHYDAILAKEPANAVALNNAAWARYEAKDPRALEFAEKAAAAAPLSVPVLDTLGVILTDRGDTDRGLQVLRQAVALAPKAPQTRLHLAEALIKAGDKGGAKAELDTVLKDVSSGPLADKAKALQGKL